MNGVQITQETARYSDNLLNSFCNFNSVFVWNKVSGGSNVGIIENSTQNKYAGSRALKVIFLNTGECIFNAGGSQMQQTITKTGLHLLSCRFYKENVNTEVILKLQMYVNGNLLPQNEIQQSLSSTFGFVDSQWNTFYQEVNLVAGDVVDFAFSVQADTAGFNLYIDGLKLELNDRNLNIPSVYSEAKSKIPQEDVVGWAYYADSLATPTITIGTTYTQITINGLGTATNENFLPKEIRGISSLFSANKITPISVGDDFDGRFDCTITAKTGTPTLIEFIIDISGATAGTNKAFTGYIQTGGTIPYDQSLPIDFFALSTFLANGGRLYAKVDTGSITIGRRNIKISRKSKAQ